MGKDSLPAESRTLIRAGAFRSDSCLVEGQLPDAHAPHIEFVACAKLAVLPLPGLQRDGGRGSIV